MGLSRGGMCVFFKKFAKVETELPRISSLWDAVLGLFRTWVQPRLKGGLVCVQKYKTRE